MKRATLHSSPNRWHSSFQSTPSWRGRRRGQLCKLIHKPISIHALMKRATAQAALPYLDTIISIHALMKRATSITGNRGLWQIFQSTPSWRGRHIPIFVYPSNAIFQSTPSWRGRRNLIDKYSIYFDISIHALMKRATLLAVYIITCFCISIHALMKRATRNLYDTSELVDISIHALMKRATFPLCK